MSESRAAGWPSDAPTAAQLKEFFAQIESGRIDKERLQSFLRPKPDTYEVMRNLPIEELELGDGAYNCLKKVGIRTIGDLLENSEDDLRQIPNFGGKSKLGSKRIEEIQEALAKQGFTLLGEISSSELRKKTEPEMDSKSTIDKLFELCKLLDVKIDLTQKIAEHHEMERRWEVEEASGSWGGEVAGPEMKASHRQDAEKLSDELSYTSAKINAVVSKLAGLIVEGDLGPVA